MTSREHRGYEALRRTFGDSAADRAADVYRDRVQPLLESLSYRFDPRGRASRQQLASMRNRHAGQRCFIIGNGPSLLKMDLRPLRNEITFGLNRGYLLFPRMGGPTTFLVAVNRYVVQQFAAELLDAPSERFLSWHTRSYVGTHAPTSFIRSVQGLEFSTDPTRGVWEGATVTYVALQLAFYFGFTDVILIGVDHQFKASGEPHRLVTSDGPDRDHFDLRYFGAGYKWQLPDLATSELAYRLARETFEASGRRIRNATAGGSLTVFPKTDYSTLF